MSFQFTMLALDGSYHGASIQNRCEDHRLI